MTGRRKPSWKLIQVCGATTRGGELRRLEGAERLVALYRFLNGEPSEDQLSAPVVDGRHELVGAPGSVDWDGFPVLAALEAVTSDELRRLRGLLAADPTYARLERDDPTPVPASRESFPDA
jgi:hypothetical protein